MYLEYLNDIIEHPDSVTNLKYPPPKKKKKKKR